MEHPVFHMNTHKFVNNYYHMGGGGGIIGRPNSNSLAPGGAVIMEESGTGRTGDGEQGWRVQGGVITLYNNRIL